MAHGPQHYSSSSGVACGSPHCLLGLYTTACWQLGSGYEGEIHKLVDFGDGMQWSRAFWSRQEVMRAYRDGYSFLWGMYDTGAVNETHLEEV